MRPRSRPLRCAVSVVGCQRPHLPATGTGRRTGGIPARAGAATDQRYRFMKSAIGRAQDLEGDGWLETTEVTMNGGKFDMMIRLFALGNFRRQALANHSLCDQRPHPDKHELETPAMQRIVFRQRPRGTS